MGNWNMEGIDFIQKKLGQVVLKNANLHRHNSQISNLEVSQRKLFCRRQISKEYYKPHYKYYKFSFILPTRLHANGWITFLHSTEDWLSIISDDFT